MKPRKPKPDMLAIRSSIGAAVSLLHYSAKGLLDGNAAQRRTGWLLLLASNQVESLCSKPPKPKVKKTA